MRSEPKTPGDWARWSALGGRRGRDIRDRAAQSAVVRASAPALPGSTARDEWAERAERADWASRRDCPATNGDLEWAAALAFARKLRQHARLIEVSVIADGFHPPEGATDFGPLPEAVAGDFWEAMAERAELELLLARMSGHACPAYWEVLDAVLRLEALYARTGNGYFAWQACALTTQAGWPIPPRWVLHYLTKVAPAVAAGTPAEHALKLRSPAGGTSLRRRAEGQAARVDLVVRVLAAEKRVDWAKTFGRGARDLPSRLREYINTERTWFDEWADRVGGHGSAMEIATRIVSTEAGGRPSARTLLNWVYEETSDTPGEGRRQVRRPRGQRQTP
jgi:hypothetical protein